MSARPTRATRTRQRDAANATKPCPDGCGHRWVQHHELPRSDPQYQPLHFHCDAADCGCIRIAT